MIAEKERKTVKETKSNGECTYTCPGADFSITVRMHLFNFDSFTSKTSVQVKSAWKCAPPLTPVRDMGSFQIWGLLKYVERS